MTDPKKLAAVLDAASALLGARQDAMDTIEEWLALARAVAACTARKPVDLLTARDLRHVVEYGVTWDKATDGPLPEDEG